MLALTVSESDRGVTKCSSKPGSFVLSNVSRHLLLNPRHTVEETELI
jgi:hypothetical protein